MKSATDLLAEMLAIHADPEKGAAELYLWLHKAVEEIREVVERGDDSARLDWLEDNVNDSIDLLDMSQLFWSKFYPEVEGVIDSLRAAIDRARGEGE